MFLMIMCSISVAVVFLLLFIYGAKNGQFDDDESPAIRMLLDSEVIESPVTEKNKNKQIN